MKTVEMKTLVINKKLRAAGNQESLIRQAARIVKAEKLKNPEVSLTEGIIFKLEEEV
jgi:hypothetical protein